ncbi:MAG: hypothetical protein JNN04_05335 [Cyclobacteriaceae bacterium]|nr:hypothetical protein [Cyclobacteriaceae bacterium]
MDEKISVKALEDYSDDYASKVAASFFSQKDKISGPEILQLCDIQQINLFVIRELLKAWKHETQKLRSPYFDYTAPQVAEALTKFHNLLSNHIAISRENFQPLLKKAVSQTLYLVLNPYDFYSVTLTNQGDPIRLDELRNEIKYIRINRVPLDRLLADLEQKKKQTIPGNEAFASLDHILEEVNFTPEDVEEHLAKFSSVVPLTLESLYEQLEEPSPSVIPPAPPVEQEAVPAPPAEQKEKPAPPIEQKEKPAPPPEVKGKAASPVEPVAPPAKPSPAPESPAKPEGKKTASQIPLYDQQPGKGTTLAENFQKRRKIKDSLTINQKFMFTKILFNGDFELFSAAVERLDELDNLNQAKNYLSNNYGEWNPESEEYQEFMEIVERRFS